MKYQMKAYTPDGVKVLVEFNDVTSIEMVPGAPGMVVLQGKDHMVGLIVIISGTWLELVPEIIH